MCGDDYSGDYNLNRVFELDNKHLEQDTIDGVGYQHHNGNIYPNIHAGVIKAVYEYFDKGDVMFNLPQAKWLHWKKPNSEVGYNMGAYVNGIILKGELLEEVDLSSVRELPAFGSEFKK